MKTNPDLLDPEKPSGRGRASRVTGAGVTIADDHVIKIVTDIDAIAEKYEAFHRLGRSLSFRAPAVLSIDRAASTLHLERIHYAASLRDLYKDAILQSNYTKMEKLLGDAGRILAELHTGLSCDSAIDWAASPAFTSGLRRYGYDIDASCPTPRAILHGDFGYSNIFLGRDGELVILDPCPDGFVTHASWERAPVYVDIGRMMSCLEGAALPWSAVLRLNATTTCRMQRAFLDGYRDVADFPVEEKAAFAFGYALMTEQISASKRLGSAVWPSLRYNRLVRKNFPLKKKLEHYGTS